MIIKNLDNGKVFIKHETCIDPDNEFLLIEDLSEEIIAFDEFFKNALEKEVIAVQIFEFADNTTQFLDYFSPKRIWEDRAVWDNWCNQFKEKHTFYLYFYHPKDRKQIFHTGTIDMSSYMLQTFIGHSDPEYFEFKDYFADQTNPTSTFEIHVNTDVIYDCLKKSNIKECKDLLREFQMQFLNKSLNQELNINPKISNKIKI